MHWSRIGEAGFVGGMRFLLAIYRWFGRWPFRIALYPVLVWYVATRAVARGASRDYLSRLYRHTDGNTPPPTLMNVFRHFVAFAESLLDKLLAWSDRTDTLNPHVVGAEHMTSLLDHGQGAVIMTAHMGCIEQCRALSRRRRGARLNVLVHTRHAPRFNRLLREISPDSELDLIHLNDLTVATAIELSERVQRGEFLVIAGDRVPLGGKTHAVVSVSFLGADAAFPIGPYVLASVLRCPLLVMLSTTRTDGTHIGLHPLAQRVELPRASRNAAAASLAAKFAALLETECRRSPLQWFNFYPFWAPVNTLAAAPS